ncbi:2'-5' RNA ligase family protein [Kribbella pittospori]|uniref:2'-5' RNA ligase family protein n=1 Tax=Kribbella pittospori TaxID=722689 RepID=A0A4R0KGE1_9ACTN|nr:2'-5' RNA ligase family protein [Kribbella pittospori]TCC59563.1 2'-5' RNA ligase family protein [Kribbella pittospori]
MSDDWAARRGLSAILITVPELAAYTDRWRSVSRSTARPHVPLTELIPPHVTVLVPWVADPTDADEKRLRAALAKVGPFELSFPTAGQFPNGTAWLRPEPFDTVRSLLLSVFEAFPECPPYGGEFPEPHPHLTISSSTQGGPAVVAEAQAALAENAPPVVQLTEVGLWREGSDGVWRQFGAVPLGA